MTQTVIPALQPPDPNVPIRPVRYADVDALHRNCWPERDLESIYSFIGRIHHTARNGRGIGVVVIGPAAEAIGYGQFVLWPRCGEISDLIIAPDYRGRGLGTALIQYLMRAARDMNASCVDIGAAQSNPRALELYRRLGFQDSYVQNMPVNGTNEPVIYLRIKFKSE